MADSPFQTADGLHSAVRQLTVFLDNRVGQLQRMIQTFQKSGIHILAMQVDPSVECALVRVVLDDTETGSSMLRQQGFALNESEVLVVELPPGEALLTVCTALLTAELNIDYMYPLLTQPTGRPALAIHCDDEETAISVLRGRNFTILTENDINPMR
jgi:hypothetical protein